MALDVGIQEGLGYYQHCDHSAQRASRDQKESIHQSTQLQWVGTNQLSSLVLIIPDCSHTHQIDPINHLPYGVVHWILPCSGSWNLSTSETTVSPIPYSSSAPHISGKVAACTSVPGWWHAAMITALHVRASHGPDWKRLQPRELIMTNMTAPKHKDSAQQFEEISKCDHSSMANTERNMLLYSRCNGTLE